jgi:hypothetical protein
MMTSKSVSFYQLGTTGKCLRQKFMHPIDEKATQVQFNHTLKVTSAIIGLTVIFSFLDTHTVHCLHKSEGDIGLMRAEGEYRLHSP